MGGEGIKVDQILIQYRAPIRPRSRDFEAKWSQNDPSIVLGSSWDRNSLVRGPIRVQCCAPCASWPTWRAHAWQLTEKTRTRVEGRCMFLTWREKLNQDRLRTTWTHATRNGHRPQAHRCLPTKLGHQLMQHICKEHLKLGLWSVVAQGGSTDTFRAK